ncbi:FKBP-type peptidyl-prolyl cis-trans isomerase [Rubrolithibacter danxiaensis]|uniref:FKBP-type peptidyl-prolyl cis-trans isomerase n=1 Tax=Rubrolithibacter danxiaensis TaxID=3390805 RepID=UPI003BF7FB38
MKKTLLGLGLAVAVFSSCNQYKKGEGGLLYKIHEDKPGPTIKDGDFIAFMAIEKTEDDSVLFSSYDYDHAQFMLKQKPSFKGDLFSGLELLSEGDSATFKVSIDSVVKKSGQPRPATLKGKYWLYTLKIKKVIPKGKLNEQDFRAKIETFIKAETDKAKSQESGKISKYVSSKNLKPATTTSGLSYVIQEKGNGPKANPGDTVVLNYTGMLLNEKVFDTSILDIAKKKGTFNPQRPYEPMKVPAGVSSTIPGFDEALLLFPKGTKATIILPSKLAYGEQGSGPMIPPYAPLIFDIEIVNIIPKKGASAPQPTTTSAPTSGNTAK